MSEPDRPQRFATIPDALQQIFSGEPPRAAAFIVTIYGDVAEPRGGILSMATLIECCAAHGLNESLVRTAVSRLVAAERLHGERIGRKSYYRLSKRGQEEFSRAAEIIYTPPPLPTDWLISLSQNRECPPGWVKLGEGVSIAPNVPELRRRAGPLLQAHTIDGVEDLPAFVEAHWPLAEVRQAYRAFLDHMQPVHRALQSGYNPEPDMALHLRLRLVHAYRKAVLADPQLPRASWPKDWPAADARALFVKIYLDLCAAADRHIGAHFHNDSGALPESTVATRSRLDALRA